jgi:NAD(P)-dependent dehydrogenase (short-subunit alcohol dehydrogenase family)
MPNIGDFAYAGKRVLVVGGATGMGAAAAQTVAALGAEVIVMDVADVTYPALQVIKIDLRDKASVDAAVDQISQRVDVLLLCAGVADGTKGLMLINFISQRAIVQRLIAKGLLARGGAIVMISSVAGLSWQRNLAPTQEFLKTSDWDSAAAWVADRPGTDSYAFSKLAMNTYIAQEAFPLLKQGIRINAILPGPTDTPLARANADLWLAFGAGYRAAAGVPTLSPQQMANAMAFLGSDAASGISGITLTVDQGHVSSGITGSYDDAGVKMAMGLT